MGWITILCIAGVWSSVASGQGQFERWQGPCTLMLGGSSTACSANNTIVLGGLFPLHRTNPNGSLTNDLCSNEILPVSVERMEAMRFAIEEINKLDKILPDIKLAFEMRDTCVTPVYTNLQTVRFVQREDAASCAIRQLPISGVVGAASSGSSIAAADLLRIFKIPQISYASTSAVLSEPRYNYFLRTVPPDIFQARALSSLSHALGLRYPGVLSTEGAYGRDGAAAVVQELTAQRGVCVATNADLGNNLFKPEDNPQYTQVFNDLTDNVSINSSATVAFSGRDAMLGFTKAIANRARKLPDNFAWFATDSWARNSAFLAEDLIDITRGTLGVTPATNVVPRFTDHYLSLNPANNTGPTRNPWLSELWRSIFNCDPDQCNVTMPQSSYCKECLANSLRNQTAFPYTQNSKIAFVFNAVYAFAKALDAMQKALCNGEKGFCQAMKATETSRNGAVDGTLLLTYLKSLTFDGESGTTVSFDEAGDPQTAVYGVYNIQQQDGEDEGHHERVGSWRQLSKNFTAMEKNTNVDGVLDIVSCSNPATNDSNCARSQLVLNTSAIQWRNKAFGYEARPRSVCSQQCKAGEMAVKIPDFPASVSPACCWKCEPCSSTTYTPQQTVPCRSCPALQKANKAHDGCDNLVKDVFSVHDKSALACIGIATIFLIPSLVAVPVIFSVIDIIPLKSKLRFSSMMISTIGTLGVFILVFLYLIPPSRAACTLRAVWSALALTSVIAPFLVENLDILVIYRRQQRSADITKPDPANSFEASSSHKSRRKLVSLATDRPFVSWAFVFIYSAVVVVLVLTIAIDPPTITNTVTPNVDWQVSCSISAVYWADMGIVVVLIFATMAVRFYCLYSGLYVPFTIRLAAFMLLASALLIASMLVGYSQLSRVVVQEAMLLFIQLAVALAIYSVTLQDLLSTLAPERSKKAGPGRYGGSNQPDGTPSLVQQVRHTLSERSLFNTEQRRKRSQMSTVVNEEKQLPPSDEPTAYGTGGSADTLEQGSCGTIDQPGAATSKYTASSSQASIESGYGGRSSEGVQLDIPVGLSPLSLDAYHDSALHQDEQSTSHQSRSNIDQPIAEYVLGDPDQTTGSATNGITTSLQVLPPAARTSSSNLIPKIDINDPESNV